MPPPLDVVVTHYRMPEGRLLDWVRWNDRVFRRVGVRAWVVSDVDRPAHLLPSWCNVVQLLEPMPTFCLSRTSNWGIRRAIDAGAAVVAKSDPDCLWSEEALLACANCGAEGRCPRYRMAASHAPEALADAKEWGQTRGTLALSARSWGILRGYDERMVGYGIEDGDATIRASKLGIPVHRPHAPFWHIAHTSGEQEYGPNRPDAWGRDDGFNPRNHARNKVAWRAGLWHDQPQSATWGR